MPAARLSRFTSGQARFGVVAVSVGIGVLGLAAWDNTLGLPWNMPGFWRGQRTICLLAAFILAAFGLFVVVRGPRATSLERRGTKWQPTRSGRRFESLRLFTREGCHLCDEAADLLARYADYLPAVQEIDIDADATLRERFDTTVPVVEIDGKVRFRGGVSELLLQRLIEGTRPA